MILTVVKSTWLTSLDTDKKERLVLTESYDPDKYPVYDNYEAIEVGKIKDIPYDYNDVMGVPVTILQYNLDNVEIFDARDNTNDERLKNKGTQLIKDGDGTINGKAKYVRVLIKKNFEIVGLLKGEFTKIDGEYILGHRPLLNGKKMYSRVLIRMKNPVGDLDISSSNNKVVKL